MLGALHIGLGVNPATEFSAMDVAGCKLWLRGDALTLSGSNVTAATDKSGNGNHVTNHGTIPYNASAINGRPGWTNAANLWLENLTSNILTAGSARTLFFVVSATTSAGGPLFSFRLNAIACTYFAGLAGYGPFGGGVFTDSADGSRNASVTGVTAAPHVYEFSIPTATDFVKLKIDGVTQTVSQSAGCRAETGTTGFLVGSWGAAGAGADFIGNYCDAIAYDHELSTPDAATIRGGLGAYYGITVI